MGDRGKVRLQSGVNPTGLVSLWEEIWTETHRDNCVGVQGGDGCIHVKERGLRDQPRPWPSSLWTWDYQYLGVCFRGPNGLTVLGLPYLLHCLVQRHLPVTTLHPITPLYPLQSKPLFPCSPPNPRALTSGSRGGGHLVPSGQYGLQPLEGVSCGVRPQETAVDAGGFSTGSARWLLLVETSFRREVCGPVAKLERSLAS